MDFNTLPPFGLAQTAAAGQTLNEACDCKWEETQPVSWRERIREVKDLINRFERGEDFAEGGDLLVAHAAHRLIHIADMYNFAPEGDDRKHAYLNPKRIALDIDEVIADFMGAYAKLEGRDKEAEKHWHSHYSSNERINVQLKENKEFWMSIPPLREVPFEPYMYITARPIPSEWTMEWLEKNGFPAVKVVTVGPNQSKLEVLKENEIDIFIDDKFSTFVEASKAGICCFLMDAPHNRKYDVGHKRIYDLTRQF